MSVVCHLVSESLDPRLGGAERSVLRVAGHLGGGWRRVLYSLRDEDAGSRGPGGVEAVRLGAARRFLMRPLESDAPRDSIGPDLPIERWQLDHLLLRDAVARRVAARPEDRHVMVSFFASYAGFVAQQVAAALALPHVASVRGSDFSRDYRHPYRHHAVAQVTRTADRLVTTNREQARTLGAWRGGAPPATIYNCVTTQAPPVPERRARKGPVRLVADCGYSFKKATHVLLEAARRLAQRGLPIRLQLVGDTDSRAEFWRRLRRRMEHELPAVFELRDLIPAAEVEPFLRAGDVYVSATFGEGCSSGRLLALILGLPIVSTACGALADLAADAGHVALAAPGSVDDFTERLADMIRRVSDGGVAVDRVAVEGWRRRLSAAEERRRWREVVTGCLEGRPGKRQALA